MWFMDQLPLRFPTYPSTRLPFVFELFPWWCLSWYGYFLFFVELVALIDEVITIDHSDLLHFTSVGSSIRLDISILFVCCHSIFLGCLYSCFENALAIISVILPLGLDFKRFLKETHSSCFFSCETCPSQLFPFTACVPLLINAFLDQILFMVLVCYCLLVLHCLTS